MCGWSRSRAWPASGPQGRSGGETLAENNRHQRIPTNAETLCSCAIRALSPPPAGRQVVFAPWSPLDESDECVIDNRTRSAMRLAQRRSPATGTAARPGVRALRGPPNRKVRATDCRFVMERLRSSTPRGGQACHLRESHLRLVHPGTTASQVDVFRNARREATGVAVSRSSSILLWLL